MSLHKRLAQWYYNIFSLFRLNTKVRDTYLVMRHGLYVICLVEPSHAKHRMYITPSKSIRLRHTLNPVLEHNNISPVIFLCHNLILHNTSLPPGSMTSTWSTGYYALSYLHCVLNRSIFHTWMSCGFFLDEFMYWVHVFGLKTEHAW